MTTDADLLADLIAADAESLLVLLDLPSAEQHQLADQLADAESLLQSRAAKRCE